MAEVWECRYCDRPAGYMGIPIKVEDEEICACGAEWEDAKILVEYDDNEIEEEYDYYTYENTEDEDMDDQWDRYDCGCCRCCGCSCIYDNDLEDSYYEEETEG